ncbi:allophanate hydrolase subunit 1 [Rhodococcus rhodnii]|uniref:Allophanate hydrolase subunit 1 n=2 Tax=Rhodococcus rhodnii TaxID=38312 RepID=R7WP81_9NOCA|nr:allophanate hydrolase subunit 1 [Rhodococcus rhodnii]EOM77126.1 allophanate hydrolase subunit 1 [Rhodococcus rhodnii LMG 5362]TXG92120.1 allophanate hydrolase subunit 1 [Rhodococcus rhodnii]
MKILPYGTRALLLELDDIDEVLAWVEAIGSAGVDVVDVVPGARTLYLSVATEEHVPALRDALDGIVPDRRAATDGPVVEIPTVYDGPDLTDVAEATGLTTDEMVTAHTGRPWRVAFTGFAPGFGYLVDGDTRLEVPRRASPRTSVPPGSVGLADVFSGVYPTSSPGGWQLIGRTDVRLFDVAASPPALLVPGMRVQFVAVTP